MVVDEVDEAVGQDVDVDVDVVTTLKIKLSTVNAQARKMDLSHVQCFRCHQFGHYASNCPVP